MSEELDKAARWVAWSRGQRDGGRVALVHVQKGDNTLCGIYMGYMCDFDIQDEPEKGLNFCLRCKRSLSKTSDSAP